MALGVRSLIFVFVCLCAHAHMDAVVWVRRLEDSFQEWVLSHYMGFSVCTQGGGKGLDPMNHLISPSFILIIVPISS